MRGLNDGSGLRQSPKHQVQSGGDAGELLGIIGCDIQDSVLIKVQDEKYRPQYSPRSALHHLDGDFDRSRADSC